MPEMVTTVPDQKIRLGERIKTLFAHLVNAQLIPPLVYDGDKEYTMLGRGPMNGYISVGTLYGHDGFLVSLMVVNIGHSTGSEGRGEAVSMSITMVDPGTPTVVQPLIKPITFLGISQNPLIESNYGVEVYQFHGPDRIGLLYKLLELIDFLGTATDKEWQAKFPVKTT